MTKFLFILVSLTLTSISVAQTLGFLQIPQETAVLARGNTGVVYSGTSSLPSNLADAALKSETLSISAGYLMWQPKVNQYHLTGVSGTYKISERLAIGAGFKDFISPSYNMTGPDGRPSGSFRPTDLTIGAGVAFLITEGLSTGLLIDYYSSTLGQDVNASGIGVNFSFKYRIKDFQAGLAIDHFGTAVNYGKEKRPLPTTLRAGVAYCFLGLTASLEADYILSAGLTAGAGLEYALMDIVFIRAGYHYGATSSVLPSFVSLGIGAKFAGISLDVSWLTASPTLGNSLSAGIGYNF